MGRSYPFSIVIYMLAMLFCLLFNVFKIHRACIEHKVSRVMIELLWPVLAILQLLNLWTTAPSSMLYLLK